MSSARHSISAHSVMPLRSSHIASGYRPAIFADLHINSVTATAFALLKCSIRTVSLHYMKKKFHSLSFSIIVLQISINAHNQYFHSMRLFSSMFRTTHVYDQCSLCILFAFNLWTWNVIERYVTLYTSFLR